MIRIQSSQIDYFRNFEKNIPHSMRSKEFRVVNDTLYWITQEDFDKIDVYHFIDALENTYIKKALVIDRYDSTFDFNKDFNSGDGTYIDLSIKNGVVWGTNVHESTSKKEKVDFVLKNQEFTNGTDVIKVISLEETEKSVDVIYELNDENNKLDIALFCNFLNENGFKSTASMTTPVNENKIIVSKEVKIPGTNVILESGDKISFIEGLKLSYDTVMKESNLPAIAQSTSLSLNPKITSVIRKDSIYNTCLAMGLPTKINAMKNVVVSVKDMSEAASVLQTIYEQFGVKGSFMVTWEGNGKVYFDPRTPVDTKMQIAYAKTHNMALPSTDPKRLIGY